MPRLTCSISNSLLQICTQARGSLEHRDCYHRIADYMDTPRVRRRCQFLFSEAVGSTDENDLAFVQQLHMQELSEMIAESLPWLAHASPKGHMLTRIYATLSPANFREVVLCGCQAERKCIWLWLA